MRPYTRVFLGMSLDGFIAGEGHDLAWLEDFNTNPPEDQGFSALMEATDTMVIGRNTYDVVMKFPEWPYTGKRVVVLTSRPLEPVHGEENYSGDLATLLERLGKEGSKGVYLDGGNAVRQGLVQGLADEMVLTILPTLLGKGVNLWEGLEKRVNLKLESSKTFPSGVVQLKYVPRL